MVAVTRAYTPDSNCLKERDRMAMGSGQQDALEVTADPTAAAC
jgi:hypothetical protein